MSTEHLVIGAGASGLAAARELVEADVPTNIIERSEAPGGNWRLDGWIVTLDGGERRRYAGAW